jgi:TnpA family transposase
MTRAFGSDTLSSSDGQKFPVKGKSLTARHLSRYFARGQGVSTYTHLSDQHATFDTKVITSTSPESPYVLDGIPEHLDPAAEALSLIAMSAGLGTSVITGQSTPAQA